MYKKEAGVGPFFDIRSDGRFQEADQDIRNSRDRDNCIQCCHLSSNTNLQTFWEEN